MRRAAAGVLVTVSLAGCGSSTETSWNTPDSGQNGNDSSAFGDSVSQDSQDSGNCGASSPDEEGCSCSPGQTHACYTGPAGTRGVGICHDGSQTCQGSGELRGRFGPCTGEVVPSAPGDCSGIVDAGVDAQEAAPPATCVRFEGCVDTIDDITVALGGAVSVAHTSKCAILGSLVGEHPNCDGVMSTVNPNVSLYDPSNGVFAINGTPYPLSAAAPTPLTKAASFTAIVARGTISLISMNPPGWEINDCPPPGPSLYVVDICD